VINVYVPAKFPARPHIGVREVPGNVCGKSK
jgi:hypothetical protein